MSDLREKLALAKPIVVGGAHDAISARLVEEAGFDAIWLSSLGVSVACKALPDINLISMSEMLEVARSITARVRIPLIADCENGYGDVHNVAYMVREFERAGVAAVCMEDNVFPKRNSFYEVDRSILPVEEMVGKIRTAKAAQVSPDFMLIARTEAIIAGLGAEAALQRAQIYQDAGADALVVHSRSWGAVEGFLRSWRGSAPLVAIPTAFPDVSIEHLAAAGFRIVIYANQALRASVRAMQEALATIRREGRSDQIEGEITTLKELERLVGFTTG